MTISLHFLVVVIAMPQIFSCFVANAIAANQTVVFVKYMIKESAQIVVMARPLRSRQLNLANAAEQQKKAIDVKK
jgi:hypothetical protein